MTPIKDEYKKRIDCLDADTMLTDMTKMNVGDFIGAYNNCQTRGFIKKIGKVNVVIETSYGGYADMDCRLMELKIPISEIRAFYKPLKVIAV